MTREFENKSEARKYCRKELKEFYYNRKSCSNALNCFPDLADFLKKFLSEENKKISNIIAYEALSDEADIISVVRDAASVIYVPAVISRDAMIFRTEEKSSGTQYGKVLTKDDLNKKTEDFLVFIPALGVHRNGSRLGRGGGYYDRWKDQFTGYLKIGLLPRTVTDLLFPAEDHDIKYDIILTDNGILDFRCGNSDNVIKTY